MKEPKKQSQTSAPSGPSIDFGELERALALMREHGLEEFEYAVGHLRIHLRKPFSASASQSRQQSVPTDFGSVGLPQSQPAAAPSVPPPAQQEPAAPSVPEPPTEELHVIKSPIVGTFYGAPNPDAAPFVKQGDTVQAGQTICIIEAMKLMNEIEADIAGEIVRILIENGQPVEYGEPLFELRPAKKKK